MVRVALHSLDPKLPSLLALALQPEYEVFLETDKNKLRQAAATDRADVIVLDFDSNYWSLADQLKFYDELSDSPIPIVLMTDDLRRSTTTEYLQRGAYDCIGKPPSLVEFRVIVRRAF